MLGTEIIILSRRDYNLLRSFIDGTSINYGRALSCIAYPTLVRRSSCACCDVRVRLDLFRSLTCEFLGSSWTPSDDKRRRENTVDQAYQPYNPNLAVPPSI